MKEIKFVIPEDNEKFLEGVGSIHTELLKLPAGMYVDLYHIMKHKMENTYYTSDDRFVSNGILSKPISLTCR